MKKLQMRQATPMKNLHYRLLQPVKVLHPQGHLAMKNLHGALQKLHPIPKTDNSYFE